MSLKTILIFLSCAYYIQAAVINVNPSSDTEILANCEDKSESCKNLADLCEVHLPLKESCPRTCGQCSFPDPCLKENGGCSHYCSGIKEASCTCRNGYQLAEDGKTCEDINECLENPCHDDGVCVNTVGSYSCQRYNCEDLDIGYENYYKSDICCPRNTGEKTKEVSGTILNNSSAQWRWNAQILSGKRHLCGAVLISENWLLTSALCVQSALGKDLRVVLGDNRNAHFRNAPRATRVERRVIQVDSYPDSEVNDIALVKVDSPVPSSELIQPISFSCGETPSVGSTCFVTGFGYKDNEAGAQLSRNLKEIALPVVSSNYCNWIYEPTESVFNSHTMLCAGHIGGGEDACFGDSGSPLVCQRSDSCGWYLSGIVSNGKGCGEIGYPGIYTKVSSYEPWISAILGSDYVPNKC